MNNQLHQEIDNYLRTHHVMTLATVDEKGTWAAALFYAECGLNLIFLSAGHTRHAQNIKANNRVSATIQENYQNWEDIKGIQFEAYVRRLEGNEKEVAIEMYLEKFPIIKKPASQIQAALTKVNWYELQPEVIFFINNAKGLGHREELKVSLLDQSE